MSRHKPRWTGRRWMCSCGEPMGEERASPTSFVVWTCRYGHRWRKRGGWRRMPVMATLPYEDVDEPDPVLEAIERDDEEVRRMARDYWDR